MLNPAPVAHNDFCYLDPHPMGGQRGLLPANAQGTAVADNRTVATASNSSIFFTAKLLVEVGFTP